MHLSEQQAMFTRLATLKQEMANETLDTTAVARIQRAAAVLEHAFAERIRKGAELGAARAARNWDRHPAFEPALVVDDAVSRAFEWTLNLIDSLATAGADLTAPVERIAYRFAHKHATQRFVERLARLEKWQQRGVEVVDLTEHDLETRADGAAAEADHRETMQDLASRLMALVASRPASEQRAVMNKIAGFKAGRDAQPMAQKDRQALNRLRDHLRTTDLARLFGSRSARGSAR